MKLAEAVPYRRWWSVANRSFDNYEAAKAFARKTLGCMGEEWVEEHISINNIETIWCKRFDVATQKYIKEAKRI